jgi:hypothetical protein
MKRYQNTLRLAIVVRCDSANSQLAYKWPHVEAVLQCVLTASVSASASTGAGAGAVLCCAVLCWVGLRERAASAFHGCHGTVDADWQLVFAIRAGWRSGTGWS